jgi:sigma-B regulation protein RsbU (phosphoserine phosphatase)
VWWAAQKTSGVENALACQLDGRTALVTAARFLDAHAKIGLTALRKGAALNESRDGDPAADSRFRRLIENSAIATNLLSRDGRFRIVNPAMCDLLGYDADVLLQMTWSDVTAPEYLADSAEAVQDLLAGRKDSLRMTKQYIHADGHRLWGALVLSCMRDSDGTVEHLIAQIIDITEQVAVRAKQSESDALYRRMMENSSVGMSLNTPDGRFVDVNDALCDMLGYDAPTLCTKTWQNVTAPATLEVDIRQTNDLAAGLIDNYRTTKQFIHSDGHLVWVDLSASCIRDPNGNIELFVAQMVDVTNEIELRAKQAESDARFRKLMEISNVAIALIAPDGKMEVVNQALCTLFGYDEETLKTKTWQEMTPADFVDEDLRNVEELVSGRLDTYRVEKPQIHADGHLFWVDVSVSCLRDSDGSVQYLFAQGIDITEEVEARELLAERDRENRMLAERLRAEIRNAAEYVKSVLPGDLDGPVEVSSRYLPSLALGGDGFNHRWIDDDHLKVYLIDVSGHGIRPALLTMSVHNLIRSGSLPEEILFNPDRMLDKLNSLFQMDDQGGAYFTIWYGVYQRSTRTLRYASAGHPPALALAHDGGGLVTARLYTRAKPIGMFADAVYICDSYTVPSGGQLLLYSDGAFELPADSATGNLLTINGFIDLCTELAARPGWSLDELVDRLRALSCTGSFDDDCALVLLTFP